MNRYFKKIDFGFSIEYLCLIEDIKYFDTQTAKRRKQGAIFVPRCKYKMSF